ncbi:GNAT family N-acetyltransferase [Paenibacillus shenyangensis]|uniref:GNAT family N-acetyltransferase n=1 Tax=Paenibacillus sp. A9 TaxID=1284352 RepID=UPI001EE7381D|nr:GNAT family N-acetyltransferase [Paenibacillus sp. A9]
MMEEIVISRPKVQDYEQLASFFRLVLTDTFIQNDIQEQKEDLEAEIRNKLLYLTQDLRSQGKRRYFLTAWRGEQIIGTIEAGTANDLIRSSISPEYQQLPEVGTILVHPEAQRQGIATRLLTGIVSFLHEQGCSQFCLDSGYPIAQRIWKRRFGEPAYTLKDQWGPGADHLIWIIDITGK